MATRVAVCEAKGLDCNLCFNLLVDLCQSTLDGRNGSSACTLIASHVVYRVLAESLEQLHLSRNIPQSVIQGFVEPMCQGNKIYDNADLRGEFLGVYNALQLLPTWLVITPRSDLGCRSKDGRRLVAELLKLAAQAVEQDTVFRGF